MKLIYPNINCQGLKNGPIKEIVFACMFNVDVMP